LIRKSLAIVLVVLVSAAACGGGGEKPAGDRAGVREQKPDGAPSARTGLSVLFLSIDTIRSDHVGCYGYKEVETPRIDKLAAEGVRFARAASVAPLTLPSHASMLTGQFPYRHRVRNNGTYRLPEGKETLADRLRAEGYRTAGFVSAFVLDARFGLARGFDTYVDSLPPERESPLQRGIPEVRAEVTIDRAIRWLEKKEGKPFFLFVHLFDPHQPYEPPEPFLTRYASNLYDGEIAYTDREIGRLLDALERLRLADETLVVLVGDHGQGLGDHGEVTHGTFAYESTVRVPFIIRWPDHPAFREKPFRRGTVVESIVRMVDAAPTILDLLGLPGMPEAEGVSLVPLLLDPDSPLGLVHYAESFSSREDFGWSEVRSVSNDRWKFILLPKEELYEVAVDPGETANRIAERPEIAAEMRALLEEIIAEDNRRRGETDGIAVDEETRRKLEALGYLAGEADVDEETSYKDLPDPKDRIDLLRKYFASFNLFDRGDFPGGLQALLDLEKEDPASPRVLASIGDAFLAMGDAARAESVYTKAIQLGARTLPTLSNRAYALLRVGRADEAAEILHSVLEADPYAQRVHARLGEIALLRGRFQEAEEEYRKEMEIVPTSGVALIGLGKVAEKQNRLPEAIGYYQRAIESPNEAAKGYYHLGLAYEKAGDIERAIDQYRKAIHSDPTLVEAYYNIAILAKKRGDRRAAAEYLNKSVEVNPRFAKGLYGIGNLLREEAKHREATEQYRLALQYDRRDSDIYLNLGVAEAALGNLAQAIEAWEKASLAAPDSPSAATARENIRSARAKMEEGVR
jgi:arylsulfatase A-like enzyme/Tfp pilus assembly protein PilF